MKKLFIIKSIVLSILCLASCSQNDDNFTDKNDIFGNGGKEADSIIVGKWKLIEAAYSIGGGLIWNPVENGPEFVFYENGTFLSTHYPECSTGKFCFNAESQELLLVYDCRNFSPLAENKDGLIIYHIDFDGDQFLSSRLTGPICIEGCPNKYEKR